MYDFQCCNKLQTIQTFSISRLPDYALDAHAIWYDDIIVSRRLKYRLSLEFGLDKIPYKHSRPNSENHLNIVKILMFSQILFYFYKKIEKCVMHSNNYVLLVISVTLRIPWTLIFRIPHPRSFKVNFTKQRLWSINLRWYLASV